MITNRKIRSIIISLGLVMVLVLACIGIILKNKETTPVSHESPLPLASEHLVQITDTGFAPKTITISKGTAVRWKNVSEQEKVTVNSDDYPTNQKYQELNLGEFPKGSSVVHIFDKSGIYTYHDQFHPDWRGTIIVKE